MLYWLGLVEYNPTAEQRAVQTECLILAALTALVEAELLMELFKVRLQLANRAAPRVSPAAQARTGRDVQA